MFIFADVNKRALVGGLLSFIPGLYSWWDSRRPTGNAFTSNYSQSIWNYHLENYQRFNSKQKPKIVAEFGPGASLGSLISALKDDVSSVIGLDIIPYANNYKLNKKLLDEIIPFKKYPILHSEINLEIAYLSKNYPKSRIRYLAPWTKKNIVSNDCIDFIFSHSVLEHIDDTENAYKQMFRILKKGGFMSHKIDHSSHELTKSWNGHYAINNLIWKILKGGKPYLLNRLTPSEHREIILKCGFEILEEKYVKSKDGENSLSKLKNENQLIKTSLFLVKK